MAGNRAEAGVEIRRDDIAVENGDGIGLQVKIDGRPHGLVGPFAGEVDVGDLGQGVHASIGAPGASG